MTRRRSLAAAAATSGLLLLAACGGDDTAETAREGTRTVEVDMVDLAFEPDVLAVAEGESVRFVFTNRGKVAHDAFIGDRDAQADHAADMAASGGDEHGHGEEENAITVEPGDTGELTYTFGQSGTVEIGCHQPGHYAAGMKITVEVA